MSENKQENSNQAINEEEPHKVRNAIIATVIILGIIIGFSAYANHALEKGEEVPKNDTEQQASSEIVYNPNITDDTPSETLSEQDIINQLNQQIEEGMIHMSINENPVFEQGDSKGNLMISNDAVNIHPQIIKITLSEKDNNELIYESKKIEIGDKIENDKLLKPLKKGEYHCTAHFYAIDEDTGNMLGETTKDIIITVKN